MRVSVVIPLYNKGPYIERALRSVSNQTRRPDEILVVDDGSTDDVPSRVQRLNLPGLRLIRQENRGVSEARNRGILEATGDWIAFLDADDEWVPGFLESTCKVAEGNPGVVAVFSNFIRISTGKPQLQRLPRRAQVLDDYFKVLIANDGSGMCSSALLAKKDALIEAGMFPPGVKYGEDVDTWARLAWTGPVGCVPEGLAIYHDDTPGSAMNSELLAVAGSFPAVISTYRRWLNAGRIPPSLEKSSRLYLNLVGARYAWLLVRVGQRRRGRKVLVEFAGDLRWTRLYWRTYIWSFLPFRLLELLVNTRNGIRRHIEPGVTEREKGHRCQ